MFRAAINHLSGFWNRCWFSTFDPLSVGMFRIWLGLLITVFYLALYPNWERYYALDGVLSRNDPTIENPYPDHLSVFSATEGWVPTQVWWWVGFVAAVGFTLGWKTRWFTVVLYVMACSLLRRNPVVMNGEDVVFRMLLLWGMFAPLGQRLSLDCYFGKGDKTWPTIWAVRGAQINFALIYAISLPNKLVDDVAWWAGDAIYLAVVSNMWSRLLWPEVFYAFDGLLSKLATYGTILVEGAFPILVWFKKTRLYLIGALAGLHLGIAVILNGVTFFSLSMVCGLWLFVPAETTRFTLQLFERLFRAKT